MTTILRISVSPRGTAAFSRIASDHVVEMLLGRSPGAEVPGERAPGARIIERDLAATPPPLVDAAFSAAILARDHAAPALAVSEALIAELEAADTLVIATPMHNYTVPAVLKAWLDQIVRIERTFRSTPAGKVGLLADRPVYVVVASGGWFTDAAPAGVPVQPDFLTPYLRAVLGTIGLRDLRFIPLEGMARGPEAVARAMDGVKALV